MLHVPRSSFYAWRNRVETPTAARRRQLAKQVARVFDDSRQTSGCRRVATQLNREGHERSARNAANFGSVVRLAIAAPPNHKDVIRIMSSSSESSSSTRRNILCMMR